MSHPFWLFVTNLSRLSLWLVLLAVIFVPLERIFAVRPQRIFRPAFLQDLGLYFLNGLIAATLLSVPLAVAVAVAYEIVPQSFYAQVDELPLWAKLLATFVIGDFGFYWGHRLCHHAPVLWHFHRIHHQPTSLDWLVNTRAHPIDIVFTRLCGLVPIYMLGLGRPDAGGDNIAPIVLTVVGTFWSFFIHSNVRWNLGWFEQFLASPHYHHWHHNRELNVNRNFSPMLPFIDRMFGTLHLPAARWPESYGIRPRAGDNGGATPPSPSQQDEISVETGNVAQR
jgi:sterol desaturase/sphingolipid hydroxylase (fatty acid hydroxylase superfamily)